MKRDKLVQHLADAARKLGLTVRTEEGNFQGGQCQVDDERLVILNRRMTMDERAELLAAVLATEPLDDVYLLPEVRGYIEKFASSASEETDDDAHELRSSHDQGNE
ncbi:hypothetical protein KKH27_10820 [bacterium]|nr:hypothetical protein [bacterium]MBU1985434.1 hypothetical protein [bacterium]